MRDHQFLPNDYLSLFGVGIVNAFRAVQGPGYFDANRLTSNDLVDGSKYTDFRAIGNDNDSYAMYTIDSQGYDSTFGNDIEQRQTDNNYDGLNGLDVGFRKRGQGTLYMTGHNTYAGPTIVEGGLLSLGQWPVADPANRASLGSSVWVETGGAFAGEGTVKGDLISRGFLIPGLLNEAGTTLNITGQVSQTGKMLFITDEDGHASQLVADGSINLSGEFYLEGEEGEAVRPYLDYNAEVVKSGGTLTTAADSYGYDLSPFLSFNLFQSGNSMILSAQTRPLTSLTAPDEIARVSRALESRFLELEGQNSQRDLDFLYNLPASKYLDTAGQLRGDIQGATLVTPPLYDAFKGEITNLHFLAAPSNRISPAAGEEGRGQQLWARPSYGYTHALGRAETQQAGSTVNRYGIVLGYERDTDVEGLEVGLMTGFNRSVIDHGDRASVNDFGLSAFARWQQDRLRLSAFASAARQSYQTSRAVDLWKNEKAYLSSDFSGHSLGGGATISYNILPAASPSLDLSPYLGLDAWRLHQNSRQESGHRTFALNLEDSDNSRVNLNTGLSLTWRPAPKVAVVTQAGYSRILTGNELTAPARFIGSGGLSFDLLSLAADTHNFTYSAAVEVAASEAWRVSAALAGQQSSRTDSLSAALTLGYSW